MNKLEKLIAYLYIFLLPVDLIQLTKKYLYSMGTSASFYLHIIGMLLLFLSICKNGNIKGGKIIKANKKVFNLLVMTVILLTLSSLIMALGLHEKLGILINRDTYIASIPCIVYNLQIIMIIAYNIYIFKNISPGRIIKIVYYSIVFIIVVGLLQVVISITKNDLIVKLFSFTDMLGQFGKNYTLASGRVNLLTMEASGAGVFINIFVIPFIITAFTYKLIDRKKLVILLIGLIPIAVFSSSSTMIIGILVNFVFITIWYIRESPKKVLGVLSFDTLIITIGGFMYKDKLNELLYLGVYKLTDADNLSTLHRFSSIFTDMMAFMKYPILGVGNGIQGFFYIKFLPTWAFKSLESSAYYYYRTRWPGSGAFIPTYLSGYGILGVFALVFLLISMYKSIKKVKGTQYEWFYTWSLLSIIVFIPLAVVSVGIYGEYFLVFILTFSFLSISKEGSDKYIINYNSEV